MCRHYYLLYGTHVCPIYPRLYVGQREMAKLKGYDPYMKWTPKCVRSNAMYVFSLLFVLYLILVTITLSAALAPVGVDA